MELTVNHPLPPPPPSSSSSTKKEKENGKEGDLENLHSTINYDNDYVHDKIEDGDHENIIKNILHHHHDHSSCSAASPSSLSPFPTQSFSSPTPSPSRSHSHPHSPAALSMDSFLLHSQLWAPHNETAATSTADLSLTLRHALGKDGNPHLLYFMKFLGFVYHDEKDPPLMQFFWMTCCLF
eukprot:scaffold1172_cov180-Ochromonas_danica.AAC.30